MHIKEFPNCCTMKIVVGVEAHLSNGAWVNPRSSVELLEKLIDTAKSCNKLATLVITTNNGQKKANKLLSAIGFDHSKWFSKMQHSNTKVRLWFISIPDLLEDLEKDDSLFDTWVLACNKIDNPED